MWLLNHHCPFFCADVISQLVVLFLIFNFILRWKSRSFCSVFAVPDVVYLIILPLDISFPDISKKIRSFEKMPPERLMQMQMQCIICFVRSNCDVLALDAGKTRMISQARQSSTKLRCSFLRLLSQVICLSVFPQFFFVRQWKILFYKNNQTHHHMITDLYCSCVLGIKCAPRAFHPHLKISGTNKYTP